LSEAHPDVAYCLAYLMKSAREGNICVSLTEELDERVSRGASMLPPFLFEKFLVKKEEHMKIVLNPTQFVNLFLKAKSI